MIMNNKLKKKLKSEFLSWNLKLSNKRNNKRFLQTKMIKSDFLKFINHNF